MRERALHAGEALVRFHRGLRADGGGIQAGAHDVDPVESGLRLDPVRVARPVHPGVVHGDVEVLLHLAPIGLAPQGLDRPVAVRRPRLPACGGGGDVGERPFRGLQQVLAFAAPFRAQSRVQADHEPLAGEVRARALRHRVGNQRLGLQRGRGVRPRRPQQLADVAGPERRDPVEPGRLEVLADAGRGEHPPVADQRHAVDAEALANLVHLAGEGGGIGRVPGEHLHRHRAAIGGAEEPVGDLPPALLPVAVVAEGRQRAAPTLQVAGRDVIEDQRAPALQVPVGQAPLDPGLARQQPVEHGQHLVAGDGPEREPGPEARRRGLRIQGPGGRQLRGGVEDPRGDGGERELAVPLLVPAGVDA